MKKLILFFCFVTSAFYFSQKYNFNYMLQSVCTRENPKYNHLAYDMVNSNDHTYYMEVGQNSFTKNYYSILIDYKNNLMHRFSSAAQMKEPYYFKYQSSEKFEKKNVFIKYEKLNIQKVDNLTYKIFTENKSKSKINDLEITFKLAPFYDDLLIFDFEPLTLQQRDEIVELLKNTLKIENYTNNFYIQEITYKYSKNSILNEKMTPKKINLVLETNFK